MCNWVLMAAIAQLFFFPSFFFFVIVSFTVMLWKKRTNEWMNENYLILLKRNANKWLFERNSFKHYPVYLFFGIVVNKKKKYKNFLLAHSQIVAMCIFFFIVIGQRSNAESCWFSLTVIHIIFIVHFKFLWFNLVHH